MSFEFSDRIQELTNKLTQVKHSKPLDDKLEEAKEQLSELETWCSRELDLIEKKVAKI